MTLTTNQTALLEKIPEFYIIGISTRTRNSEGQSAKDIEALWQKFVERNIQHRIPNKVNSDIYAVYTAYESDHRGEYTTIIGAKVSSLEDVPEDMVGLTVKDHSYLKITSKGVMPAAIGNTWLAIWSDKDLDAKRAYQVDFTIYGKNYFLGENAEAETYLSIQ